MPFSSCLSCWLFSGHPNRSTNSRHLTIRTAQLSLLPFILFIILFLGTGLYMQSQGVDHAFERLPGEVAILPALILAPLLYPKPLNETLAMLVKGAGNSNIITVCMIFLLAGAFSSVAAATGGVQAVVNAGLALIPSEIGRAHV